MSTSAVQRMVTIAVMVGAVLAGVAGAGPPAAFAVTAAAEGVCPGADPAAPPADCPSTGDTTPISAMSDDDTTTTTVPDTTTTTVPDTTTTTVPDTTTTTVPDTTTTTVPDTTTTTTTVPSTTTTTGPSSTTTTTTVAGPTTTTTRGSGPTTTTTVRSPDTTTTTLPAWWPPGPTTTTTWRGSGAPVAPNGGGNPSGGNPPVGGSPGAGSGTPKGSTPDATAPPSSSGRPRNAAPAPTPVTAGGLLLPSRANDAQPRASAPIVAPPADTAAAGALNLDELFPPVDATPDAGSGEGAAPRTDQTGPVTAEAAPDFSRVGHSRVPLIAGLAVTLAVLIFGGGFLWWRNRDSQYWPA